MASERLSVSILLLVTLGSSALSVPNSLLDDRTATLQMLDAMQQLMTGNPSFDRVYYQELYECMGTFHPNLTASQDGAWQGIIDYWTNGGGAGDRWGNRDTNYIEQNATNADFLNMTFYEPCNTASNIAYYHAVTEFCSRKASGKSFSMPEEYVSALGIVFSGNSMASSFHHMSHTLLGWQQDNWSIRVMSYLIHQGSLSALPEASSILTDLNSSPRNKTSLELANAFMNMYLSLPVNEWYNHTAAFDIPDYYLSFAGIFGTVFTIAFEPQFVDMILPILSNAFDLPSDFYEFITVQYLPEIRNLTTGIELGPIKKTAFLKNTLSAFVKLIYAFLWQEERLTDNPVFLNETVNEWGWKTLPIVNAKVNALNNFEYFEPEFQNGTDVYPGDVWCNPTMPHAKWHLESGVGLLDLVYLADEVFQILSTPQT